MEDDVSEGRWNRGGYSHYKTWKWVWRGCGYRCGGRGAMTGQREIVGGEGEESAPHSSFFFFSNNLGQASVTEAPSC